MIDCKGLVLSFKLSVKNSRDPQFRERGVARRKFKKEWTKQFDKNINNYCNNFVELIHINI